MSPAAHNSKTAFPFVLARHESERLFVVFERRPTNGRTIYSIGISNRAMMPGSPPRASGKPVFYGEKVSLSEEEAKPLLKEGKCRRE